MRVVVCLLFVFLVAGCANSLSKEQSTGLEATLNAMMIGLGVASLVTGNPDGAFSAWNGAAAIADGTVGLASQGIEQGRNETSITSEALCFCPYGEAL